MRITKYKRLIKITYLRTAAFVFLISFFLLPVFTKIEETGDNVFDVRLNGVYVGSVADAESPQKLLKTARIEAAREQDGMLLVSAELEVKGREVLFGQYTSENEALAGMREVLKKESQKSAAKAYTIKINQLMVNVRTIRDVEKVLQTALDQYQEDEKYVVGLGPDKTRELNVLTAAAVDKEKLEENEGGILLEAGAMHELSDLVTTAAQTPKNASFKDFEYGLKGIGYDDEVEIVESYLSDDELLSAADAAALVTARQEKEIVYEVKPGDTLSEIAIDNEIPLDKIIELNANLEGEDSVIRIGDELKLTEPEPELSLLWQEELYYEEDYEADIEYVYNDDWYTNESEVLQQPSAGHRKVAARKTYRNDKEISTEILKEEISMQAVAKIVEKGTKVPPTFLKPISGGRISSNFGRRKAPKKGASTYHKGIDWATPVGTAVMASSAGTVARAGWGSGYGYVVYVDHADGRQTRYGHLSKILVKPGDKVAQGQKLALSGNTGRSTGPHLHFELLIHGSAVNPLDYLH